MSPGFADQLIALVLFALASSVTPGPNNVMLLASGVNYGFRRTVPHMLGVALGSPAMVACVTLGLGSVFRAEPRLHDAIEVVGVVYLLWLAWRIGAAPVDVAVDASAGRGGSVGRPLGFLAAVGFQWVNVKAWIVAISATSIYVPQGWSAPAGAALIFAVMLVTASIAVVQWTAFGTLVARFLRRPRRRRIFNLTMAGLLVASLWPAFVDIAGWFGAGRAGP
jgi:threonine/homoserine/homoserine lactone efflux protein